MKVWKANRYLSLAVLVYYLLIIYREGIMGFRFRLVREPWNMDVDSVDRNTHYINHMIKTRLPKSNGVLISFNRKCLPKTRGSWTSSAALLISFLCLPAKHKNF